MTRAITSLNGQLPEATLRTVGWDYYGRPARFRLDAADSWERMRELGMPHAVSDTYRDLARQRTYYANPPSGPGLAAVPGTSWHGEGLAVDARADCLTWLASHGRAHGWTRPIPVEPWHFEYDPARDQHANQEDDDMPTAKEIADAVVGQLLTAGDAGLPARAPLGQLVADAAVHSRKAANPPQRWVKHGGIDAPQVVVDADTLRVAQGNAVKLDRLLAAVAALGVRTPAADVDEQALAAAIADALDDALAARVADVLSERLRA